MSFTKAKIKRFNEIEDDVPPVGTYDPKFLKSERLKQSREHLASSLPLLKPDCDISTNKSFIFRTPLRAQCASYHQNHIKIQEYEKKIRCLLKERSDLLKNVASKEEEMKKINVKLQIAIRERSHFQASMITNEKESKELRRVNEILKIKVTTLESVDKTKGKGLKTELAEIKGLLVDKEHKLSDLSQELEAVKKEHAVCVKILNDKDEEIAKISSEMSDAIKSLEIKLEQAQEEALSLQTEKNYLVESNEHVFDQMHILEEKIKLDEDTIRELMIHKDELNTEIADCRKELENKQQHVTRTIEDIRKENMSLLSRIEQQTSRRLSLERCFSSELENIQQKLTTTEDCSRSLQDYRDSLMDKVATLKQSIKDFEEQQLLDVQTIKELKQQLMGSSSQLAAKEQALLDANIQITSLNDQIIELKSAQKNVGALTEKCFQLENQLACHEVDRRLERDKWETDTLMMKLTCDVVEQELATAQQKAVNLQSELDSERERCENLSCNLVLQKETASAEEARLLELIAEADKACQIQVEMVTEIGNQMALKSAEINLLKDTLESEISEKAELKELLQNKLKEISALSEALHNAEQHKIVMDNNLAELTLKLNITCKENEEKVSVLEEEITALKIKNKNQKCEITKLLDKVLFLKEQLNFSKETEVSTKKALVAHKKERVDLMLSLDEKTVENRNIKESLMANEKVLSQTIKEKESSVKVGVQLQQQIQNLESKLAEQLKLCADAQVTNSKLEVLEHQLSVTEAKKVALENETLASNSAIKVLREEMNCKLSTAEEDLKLFKDKNEEYKIEIKKLQEEEVALKEQHCQSLREIEIQRTEISELEVKLETEMLKTKKIEEMLDIAVNDKRESVKEKEYLEIVCSELKENVFNLEKQCMEEKCLHEETCNELKIQSEINASLISDYERSKSLLTEIEKRNVILQNQLEDFSLQLFNAKESLSQKEKKIDEINLMFNATVVKVDDMSIKLRAAEEKICYLIKEAENTMAAKMDLENTYKELEAKLAESQNMFLIAECQMKEKISLLSEQCTLEQSLKIDFEKRLLEANDTNVLLDSQLETAFADLNNFKLSSDEDKSKMVALQSDIVCLTSSLEEKTLLVDELNSDLAIKVSEIQHYKLELENKSKEMAQAENDITSLKNSLGKRYEEISELQTVIENNHQLIGDVHDNSIVEDLRSATQELDTLYKTCEEQNGLIQEIKSEKEQLSLKLKQMETEKDMHMAQTEWYSNREKDLLRELDIVEESALLKQEEFTRILRETQKQLAHLENETESYKLRKENEGRQNEEMLQALTNEYESHTQALSKELENLTKEALRWKTMFEELQLKVAPFQDQLDAYEIERNVLMSKNNETMSDFTKLSQEFATLLGHQNHKQKIHYVYKLKEENLSLKEENTKLWTEVLKLRKTIHRKDIANISKNTRRFEPEKAFQHSNKENTLLREVSRNFDQ